MCGRSISPDFRKRAEKTTGHIAYAEGRSIVADEGDVVVPSSSRKALLLIAHGSRRPEANADLEFIAAAMRERGRYAIVQVSYLELTEPTIADGGARCVEHGATEVTMLPYFLSPGVHVREDLLAARSELSTRFPSVLFRLAEPLGRHPMLLDVVDQRAAEAEQH